MHSAISKFQNHLLKLRKRSLLYASLGGIISKYSHPIYYHNISIYPRPIQFFTTASEIKKIQLETDTLNDMNLKIASAASIEDLILVAEQNLSNFSKDHYVYWVKNLGKMLIKQFSAKNYGTLVNSEIYEKIVQNILSNIDNLTPTEILDVMYWLRRSSFEKVTTYVTEKNLQEIVEKIESNINDNQYNLNTLIRIFYDFSFMKKQANTIVSRILKELKNDSQHLSAQKASELLDICALNKNTSSFNFYTLVEIVQKYLETSFKTLEVEEKCKVFKNLAMLELQINPPRFRYSHLQFNLKDDLMNSYGEMSETAVINLLEGYSYLGVDFPAEMLKNLKDIILSILANSADGLRTFFLITLIEKKHTWRKSFELSGKEIQMIYSIIAKRLPTENYFNSIRNLERVVDMYIKADVKNEELLQAIYKKVVALELKFISFPMMKLFHKNDLDTLVLIEPYLERKKDETLPDWRLFLASALLSDPLSESRVKKLKDQVLNHPTALIKTLNEIDRAGLRNSTIDSFLNDSLKALLSHRESLHPKDFFKAMFASCQNKQSRTQWIEIMEKDFKIMGKEETSAFFQAFFSQDEHFQGEQVFLFCNGFALMIPKNVDLKKLLELLIENNIFFIQSRNLVDIIGRFFDNVVRAIDANPQEYRLSHGFGIIRRLDLIGKHEKTRNKFAIGIYPHSRPKDIIHLDNIIFYQYLLENDILQGEDAKVLYKETKKSQDKISQSITLSKVASYILHKLPQEISNNVFASEVKQLIHALNSTLLTENDSKKAINLLCSILRFHPTLINDFQNEYVKFLSMSITTCGPIHYKEIVRILPEQYFSDNKRFYEPMIEIIVKSFNEYKPKFNLKDLILFSKKFGEMITTNDTVFKSINNLIVQNISRLDPDETMTLLESYTSKSIVIPEIYDAVLTKMINDVSSYQRYFKFVTFNLFKVGYQGSIVPKFLNASTNRSINQDLQSFASILLIIIQNFQNEAERIETLIKRLKDVEAGEAYLIKLYIYFKIAYNQKPNWKEALEKNVRKSSFLEKNNLDHLAPKNVVDEFCVYLKKMNVDYIKFKEIGGIKVDLFLPQSETIIKLFTRQDFSTPYYGLKGLAILNKKTLMSLKPDNCIFINTQDFFAMEHPAKIEYLKKIGIKTIVKQFDFSDVSFGNPENQFKISGGQISKGRDSSRINITKQAK